MGALGILIENTNDVPIPLNSPPEAARGIELWVAT